MIAHSTDAKEVIKTLSTDQSTGLSSKEAGVRLEKYGANKLREKKKKTNFQRFIDQFKDAMILILIAAAIVSFTVICVEKNWRHILSQRRTKVINSLSF